MDQNSEPNGTELRVFVEGDEPRAAPPAEELRGRGWRVAWTRVDSAATTRDEPSSHGP